MGDFVFRVSKEDAAELLTRNSPIKVRRYIVCRLMDFGVYDNRTHHVYLHVLGNLWWISHFNYGTNYDGVPQQFAVFKGKQFDYEVELIVD